MNPIPWYQSPVQMRIVITVLTGLAGLFPTVGAWLGLADPGQVEKLVAAIFAVISVVAATWAGHKRATSTVQPLTLTQAGADSKATPAGQVATDTVKAAAKETPK